jgi:hypothetical protein
MQANSEGGTPLTPPYPNLTPFLPHNQLKYIIPYPSYPYRKGGTHESPPHCMGLVFPFYSEGVSPKGVRKVRY